MSFSHIKLDDRIEYEIGSEAIAFEFSDFVIVGGGAYDCCEITYELIYIDPAAEELKIKLFPDIKKLFIMDTDVEHGVSGHGPFAESDTYEVRIQARKANGSNFIWTTHTYFNMEIKLKKPDFEVDTTSLFSGADSEPIQ